MNMWTEAQLVLMGLVLLRTSSFIVASPIWGTPQIPAALKILFSLSLAVAVAPTLSGSNFQILDDQLGLAAGREVLVGLALGLFLRLLFSSISIGGEMISFSMGLNSAQVFNPMLGSQSNAIEQFYMAVVMLLFFGVNGHHMFLEGWMQSFKSLPLAGFKISLPSLGETALLGGEIIEIGLKIAGPMVVTIFCLNLVMGVLGRAVPQINVLVTSFPISFLLGLFVIFISLPVFVYFMQDDFGRWGTQFSAFIKGAGRG